MRVIILDFDDFVANEYDFLKKVNNIYISERQLEILKKYGIDIKKCKDTSELIFYIESYLNNSEYLEDLEWVSKNLSEYNYYINTNK